MDLDIISKTRIIKNDFNPDELIIQMKDYVEDCEGVLIKNNSSKQSNNINIIDIEVGSW